MCIFCSTGSQTRCALRLSCLQTLKKRETKWMKKKHTFGDCLPSCSCMCVLQWKERRALKRIKTTKNKGALPTWTTWPSQNLSCILLHYFAAHMQCTYELDRTGHRKSAYKHQPNNSRIGHNGSMLTKDKKKSSYVRNNDGKFSTVTATMMMMIIWNTYEMHTHTYIQRERETVHLMTK